jgi:protein N-lysine methyltransferase METTL21A
MDDAVLPLSLSSNEDTSFTISESLVPTRDRKEAGLAAVNVNGLLEKPLLLKEDLTDGCGGQLWPAGMLLSDYMLREHRFDLGGKTMFVSFVRQRAAPLVEVP